MLCHFVNRRQTNTLCTNFLNFFRLQNGLVDEKSDSLYIHNNMYTYMVKHHYTNVYNLHNVPKETNNLSD